MSENKGKHIVRRMIITLVSITMIAGFIVLFIAASKDRNKATCNALSINIENNNLKSFINRSVIKDSLIKDKKLNPVGKQLSDLNIQLLEQSVKTFPWVKDAQLYVDNDNVLQINITERIPVARIFTVRGNSFYMDEQGTHLPINGNFAVKIPVITGFPADTVTNASDSLLTIQIISLSRYIDGNSFWTAQIDQININSKHQFELIPAVGNALIELGDGNNIGEKFDKLLTFYQKGLNNVGWGYYDTLNLQYKGQIVATRKNNNESPVIDSLLAQGYKMSDNPLK